MAQRFRLRLSCPPQRLLDPLGRESLRGPDSQLVRQHRRPPVPHCVFPAVSPAGPGAVSGNGTGAGNLRLSDLQRGVSGLRTFDVSAGGGYLRPGGGHAGHVAVDAQPADAVLLFALYGIGLSAFHPGGGLRGPAGQVLLGRVLRGPQRQRPHVRHSHRRSHFLRIAAAVAPEERREFPAFRPEGAAGFPGAAGLSGAELAGHGRPLPLSHLPV